jgi:lysophospholipase L1-like esterase
MRRTFYSLLFAFCLAACSATDAPSAMPPTRPLRFLALGDSYTIGESVREAERWPVQLAGLLRASGVEIEDPLIVARTGWTTDELAAGLEAANPQGPFDLVSLLIGVNNQYRGRDLEEYRREFASLLARAIAFAGGQPDCVLVLSIPDWGVTGFATGLDRAKIAREIEAFNAVNLEEAQRAGARYVDVTPVSRRAATESGWIAADNLHPSGQMYAEWARLALPEAAAALAAAP